MKLLFPGKGGEAYIDLEILLPYCTLENEPDLLRETLKSNMIARYSSIFKVSKILLYNSRKMIECKEQKERLTLYLTFFRTPPYLRKKIFGKRKELRYSGIAYPLQTPTHTLKSKPQIGEIREGLVLRVKHGKALVEVGLKAPVSVNLDSFEAIEGKTVFLKVSSVSPLKLELTNRPKDWIGYEIEDAGRLESYLRRIKGERTVIGTSRKGEPVWENWKKIEESMKKTDRKVTIVFGEPYRGIYEIAKDLSINTDDFFDGIYNFVKDQGTKTIRTEEAIPIVLSVIHFINVHS
ncbi:MAG: putative RNA uridine N3 methyltransferase [Fervidicoccaceae archaeon]